MKPIVYIEYQEKSCYAQTDFSPSVAYPEYPFELDQLNPEQNDGYEMVRNCLQGMGWDANNFGKKQWNPLGEFVKPGMTVLVKPNLVMHYNENLNVVKNSMECLVTHPSCIRAICDYCVIALKGDGKLIIGDAPMQGCDFQSLIKKMHYDEIIKFYQAQGISVELKDFREYQSKFNKNRVIVGKEYTSSEGIQVELGTKSQHMGSNSNGEYQVSDYDKQETIKYHHGEVHNYEIASDVLQADVLINFCKPKTHRLAGFTAAMKNMVGITYNKATLPHRTAGSKEEGGDAYLNKSALKRFADQCLTQKIRAEEKHQILKATALRYIYGISLVTARKFGKDNFYIGSWYGNDTIWRTICDLNQIIVYADKQGKIQETPQRKVLHFGDMIISGQRNGPVSPEPKELGVIIASEDAAAFDMTVCKIMGFDFDYIPLCRNLLGEDCVIKYTEPDIKSNDKRLEGELTKIQFPKSWSFRLHDAWNGMK